MNKQTNKLNKNSQKSLNNLSQAQLLQHPLLACFSQTETQCELTPTHRTST